MKSKYVVLRSRGNVSRNADSSPLTYDHSLPSATLQGINAPTPDLQFSVQIETVDRHEANELLSENDVQEIAPVMPLRLIEPMDMHATTEAEQAPMSWGIAAVRADQSAFTGQNVVVAVLDTGIDKNHPAFNSVELVQYNFTEDAPEDLHGHGTHCAATIFGRDVDGQRIGVARGISKALIGKVLGKGTDTQTIIKAILWASQNGAHVISISLGVDFVGYAKNLRKSGFPEELAISRALEAYRANVRLYESVTHLFRSQAHTTLLVAAAGNESKRKIDPRFEVAAAPPATAEGIVSVAALGQTPTGLEVAWFSNTGAILSAPGIDVTSAALGGGLATMSGTSMAAPHVAGIAALWAEKILKSGPLTLSTLNARLVGSATTDALIPGTDMFDVGAGLATAP